MFLKTILILVFIALCLASETSTQNPDTTKQEPDTTPKRRFFFKDLLEILLKRGVRIPDVILRKFGIPIATTTATSTQDTDPTNIRENIQSKKIQRKLNYIIKLT